MKSIVRSAEGLAVAVLLVAAPLVAAQAPVEKNGKEPSTKKSSEKSPESATPKTYTVQEGPLKKVVELKGVFEAKRTEEVSLHLVTWTTLKVLEAVPLGTAVQKGDLLVKFDLEKIDETIGELETSRHLAELAFERAEKDLEILEKSVPLTLASAERSMENTKEDMETFLAVDRPLSEKSAQFMVKYSQNYLDYQKEELHQLEKMYEADDLTEESEEIILRRQRDTVERYEFSLEQAKVSLDQTLKVSLPRREESMRERVRREELSLQKANLASLTLQKTRLDLEKMRYEHEKTGLKLQRLRKDRETMSGLAPADGVVYYGQCTRGKWSSITTMESKLRRGGSVGSNNVFITLVKPRPIFVRAVVEEKDLADLQLDSKGTILPTSFPDSKLPARLESVSLIPISAGKFDASVIIETNAIPKRIMPGMACTVKVVAYENPNAISVPAKAVFEDDDADGKKYVYVSSEKKKPEKRFVNGRKIGEKFEISAGLKVGEKILQSKPGDDS